MADLNGSSPRWQGLAEEALAEAAKERSWTAWSSEGDVQVSTSTIPGHSLPMFRGCMQPTIPVEMADVVRVLLSDSCRRFWDPSYAESQLIYDGNGHQGHGTDSRWAVLCTKQKASPVASASVWVHVSTCRCSEERFTYVCSSLPEEHMEDPLVARHLSQNHLTDQTRLRTPLWAMDMVKVASRWEVSFTLHTEATSFRLPNFMLKQILASWVGLCMTSLWRMAASKVAPKGPVSVVDSENLDRSEVVSVVSVAGTPLSFAKPLILDFR